MTAAVAAGVPDDALQGRRRAPGLDGQRGARDPAGRRVREDHGRDFPVDDSRSPGVPYLARVPDCEPPFDDETESPSRIRPAARRALPSQPVARPAGTGLVRSRGTSSARVTAPTGSGAAGAPDSDWRTASDGGTTARRVAGGTSARGAALAVTSRTAPAPPRLHSAGVPAWSDEADVGVRLTTTADLPSAERSASVLARAVIEVLSGRRPLGQLRMHCAPDVYAGLADRPTFASAALPHLVSVRVCEPADGVAEVSVAYRRAERVRALAFRIQGVDGRWRMTALQLC